MENLRVEREIYPEAKKDFLLRKIADFCAHVLHCIVPSQVGWSFLFLSVVSTVRLAGCALSGSD